MTTNQNNPDSPESSESHERFDGRGGNEAERLLSTDDVDLLISRTVDGSASATEWVLLQGHAIRTPGVWMDLATTYRDAQLLEERVGHAGRRAEHVALPDASQPRLAQHDSSDRSSTSPRRTHGFTFARAAAWGGWAAAAVLALALVSPAIINSPSSSTNPTQPITAGVGGGLSDMLNSYLAKGKADGTVVGELPEKQILSTVEQQDGSVEVVYVRLILERATVDKFYRSTINEAGQRWSMPTRLTVSRASQQPRSVRQVY